MPDHCCAVGCTNKRKKGETKVFYRIPSVTKNIKQTELWITAIRRERWPEKSINVARICSDHFILVSFIDICNSMTDF